MNSRERTRIRFERILKNAKRYGEQMSELDKQRYREMVDPPSCPPVSSERSPRTVANH